MKKMMITSVGLALMGVSSLASADLGIGVKASTLGAGVELGVSLSDRFVLRGALNKYSKGDNQTIDGIDYTADLDLNSTSLFLDWHPLKGTFHLTAGYLMSSNQLSASATPSQAVVIGDNTYQPSDVGRIDAVVDLGSGPYVGLGWGNLPAKGLGFSVELGVVQMGTPDADLTIDDPNGFIAANNDIEKERANIENDLDQYDTYPVVSLGLSYGF